MTADLLQEAVAAGGVTLFAALVLGVVEGLTEFLPVSSTGHLILAGALLSVNDPPLEVGIQFGAISAILVLYWRRLWNAAKALLRPGAGGAPNLLLLIAVAALPAVAVGLAAGHAIKAHLFTPGFVAATTAIGGALLLVLERWCARRPPLSGELSGLGWRQAIAIGLWQCLAVLPGTSRSAATIAGGMLCGLSRAAAAEFSFLLGLPILYGACAKEVREVRGEAMGPFLVATLVAFLTAMVVVRPFVRFLRAHTFAPFAVYRLLLGAVVALACWRHWLPA